MSENFKKLKKCQRILKKLKKCQRIVREFYVAFSRVVFEILIMFFLIWCTLLLYWTKWDIICSRALVFTWYHLNILCSFVLCYQCHLYLQLTTHILFCFSCAVFVLKYLRMSGEREFCQGIVGELSGNFEWHQVC